MSSAFVHALGYSEHHQTYSSPRATSLKHYLLRFQLKGQTQALINGSNHSIQPGDLLICRPGDAYQVNFDPCPKHNEAMSADYFLFGYGSWMDKWWSELRSQTVIPIADSSEIIHTWRQLIVEKHKRGTDTNEILTCYLKVLCLKISRIIVGKAGALQGTTNSAYRMKYFIDQHAAFPLKLETIAEQAGLSISRASHLFKETFHQSPIDYLIDVRLQMACGYMNNSCMSLKQIAEFTGFNNYNYFHRIFCKRFGVSPTHYKNKFPETSDERLTMHT